MLVKNIPPAAPKIITKLNRVVSKNSPTILTGMAVAGLVTTVIFAVKATPKANEIIKANSRKNHDGDPYAYTKKEAIQSAWKCYIPTAIMGTVTIVCVVGANHISLRRNAALAGLYSLTETAFKEYQSKVVETIGKNKELKVRDEITADTVKNSSSGKSEVIITGRGSHLCRDCSSGRYFRSDIEKIRKAVNDLNEQLLTDMWISLNDLYFALGLSQTDLGSEVGWHVEHGLIEIQYSTQLTENDEPCLALNYKVHPRFI